MIKKEFREILEFPATLLYIDDLRELDGIISDTQRHKNDTTKIELIHKNQHFKANSLDELFSYQNLPQSIDKLIIERMGWVEKDGISKIERGLSLTMYHNYVSCQVYSYDEDWHRGKISRLQSFFKCKRPWYYFLNKISPIFPAVVILTFIYSMHLVNLKQYILSLPFVFISMSLLIISVLTSKDILFPYVKIILSEKKKTRFDWDKISALIITISALVIIIEFIYKIIPK